MHPLLPLRALQPGDRRGRAAPAPGARRLHVRGDVRRPPVHRPLPRQHHRAVPGGGADLGGLPVPGPPLGHRGRRLGLHALPEPVQRDPYRARRAHGARAGPRPSPGRRRLAVRQGTVRLPDGRVGRADHRAARPPGRGASPRQLGGGARRGRRGPARGRRADGRDRRRLLVKRGGLPGAADRPQGTRLSARGVPRPGRSGSGTTPQRGRPDAPGPGRARPAARGLAAGAERQRLRPRRGRVDPGDRLRPAARDADPRPADPQGRAARRHPARRRHRPPERPRWRRGGDRPLLAGLHTRVPCGAGRGGSGPRATSERVPSPAPTPSGSPGY